MQGWLTTGTLFSSSNAEAYQECVSAPSRSYDYPPVFCDGFFYDNTLLLFKWNCRNRDNALRFQGVANESVSQSA